MLKFKSFTLVEILVVLGILIALAGITIAIIDPEKQRDRARDAVLKKSVSEIATILQAYQALKGTYPDPADLTDFQKYIQGYEVYSLDGGSGKVLGFYNAAITTGIGGSRSIYWIPLADNSDGHIQVQANEGTASTFIWWFAKQGTSSSLTPTICTEPAPGFSCLDSVAYPTLAMGDPHYNEDLAGGPPPDEPPPPPPPPSNTAPTCSVTPATASVASGATQNIAITITDPDTGDTHTYSSTVENLGTETCGTLASATTANPIYTGPSPVTLSTCKISATVTDSQSATGTCETGNYTTTGPGSTPNPVMELKFDEGAGDTASDSSGNGNNGDLGITDCAGWSTDGYPSTSSDRCPDWTTDSKSGKSLRFWGVTGRPRIAVGDPVSLEMTSQFTLSAWIKAYSTSFGSQQIVSKFASSNFAYQFGIQDSSVRVDVSSGPSGDALLNSSGAISANVWTHVVATFNAGTLKLYLNGVKVGEKVSTSVTSINSTGTSPVWIGDRSSTSQPFNGWIDEVKVYNKALDDAQVQALYSSY